MLICDGKCSNDIIYNATMSEGEVGANYGPPRSLFGGKKNKSMAKSVPFWRGRKTSGMLAAAARGAGSDFQPCLCLDVKRFLYFWVAEGRGWRWG